MAKKNHTKFFIIGTIVFYFLFLFYIYATDGLNYAIKQLIVLLVVIFCFSLIHFIARYYPVSRKGWNQLGPDAGSLMSIAIPLFMFVLAAVNTWSAKIIFDEQTEILKLKDLVKNLFNPLLIMFWGLFSAYGILTGFVRRLRWNSEGVEYRDMFFETRYVRWDEIERVELGGTFDSNEVILKHGPRIIFAHLLGRAGLSQLEADVKSKGIEIISDRSSAASSQTIQ